MKESTHFLTDDILSFFQKRYSVRSFLSEPVPQNHIETMVQAASLAPSAKNIQNWHFVILKNKEKIDSIAQAIESRNTFLSQYAQSESERKFSKMVKYHTVFKGAPVLVLLYAGSYKSNGLELMKTSGIDQSLVESYKQTAAGIQNISAAMENFQLAAAHMGYGTCWMTGPNYAADLIEKIVDFKKENYALACMTPLGRPKNKNGRQPARKPLSEIITIIE